MILVNEIVRYNAPNNLHTQFGVHVINSDKMDKSKCTWICHNNTSYCLKNHVKINKRYLRYTNQIYFGTIKALAATGNYAIANILLYVLLFPILIYALFIKSIGHKKKLKQIKLAIRNGNFN